MRRNGKFDNRLMRDQRQISDNKSQRSSSVTTQTYLESMIIRPQREIKTFKKIVLLANKSASKGEHLSIVFQLG